MKFYRFRKLELFGALYSKGYKLEEFGGLYEPHIPLIMTPSPIGDDNVTIWFNMGDGVQYTVHLPSHRVHFNQETRINNYDSFTLSTLCTTECELSLEYNQRHRDIIVALNTQIVTNPVAYFKMKLYFYDPLGNVATKMYTDGCVVKSVTYGTDHGNHYVIGISTVYHQIENTTYVNQQQNQYHLQHAQA
jgi:hypothetical protein